MNDDLIYRLRKRAEIREQISTRKSVQEGKADRIAALLREAADALESAHLDGASKDTAPGGDGVLEDTDEGEP